jgi:hypothetical protein
VDKALVQLIIATTPKAYIENLEDPELSYTNVATLQLVTHLHTTYRTMTASNRDANLAHMNAPWAPPMLVETLLTQLEAGQRFAVLATEPIANSQLTHMGQNMVNKTGMYPNACKAWRLLPEAQQTWPAFKIHFANHDRDRLANLTAA